MDEVRPGGSSSCSSEAEQTQSRDTIVETASSFSSSGWCPRELAFAPFVPLVEDQQQKEDKRVNAAGKSSKYRAVIRKPVSLLLFFCVVVLVICFAFVVIALVCYLELICVLGNASVCCEGFFCSKRCSLFV